jgi:hypothetical protein
VARNPWVWWKAAQLRLSKPRAPCMSQTGAAASRSTAKRNARARPEPTGPSAIRASDVGSPAPSNVRRQRFSGSVHWILRFPVAGPRWSMARPHERSTRRSPSGSSAITCAHHRSRSTGHRPVWTNTPTPDTGSQTWKYIVSLQFGTSACTSWSRSWRPSTPNGLSPLRIRWEVLWVISVVWVRWRGRGSGAATPRRDRGMPSWRRSSPRRASARPGPGRRTSPAAGGRATRV